MSAGSTPTQLSAAVEPVNEMRAGTYLLGDRQQWAIGAVPDDGIAIAVAATVVSAAVDGQVVIDAGAKTLTKDVATYLEGYGAIPAYPDAVIERLSDYHGVVRIPDGTARPGSGRSLPWFQTTSARSSIPATRSRSHATVGSSDDGLSAPAAAAVELRNECRLLTRI